MKRCDRCGAQPCLVSPAYGPDQPDLWRHFCSRIGVEVMEHGDGTMTKEESYRAAGRPDLAERFGRKP